MLYYLSKLTIKGDLVYKNGKRCMAWIAKIDEVKSIENADRIDTYRIGGWWIVDKKGAYSVGDLVVYISIDSWIPHSLAPFLSKGQDPREYNGIPGQRLRTVKLRGQVSQGLLLPLTALTDAPDNTWGNPADYLDDDVAEILGIQKWEPPVPAHLAGEVRGLFPGYIPKTDQERCQNLTEEIDLWIKDNLTWEMTEKLDGSSMTIFWDGDHIGVCSRNLELKENDTNSMWRLTKQLKLDSKLPEMGRFLALQGEIIGEGIQGNPYRLRGQEFYLYDIYDIDQGQFLSSTERRNLADQLGIKHVPVLSESVDLTTVETLLKTAEGPSVLTTATEREGIVFKCLSNTDLHFKAISNKFLMKTGK